MSRYRVYSSDESDSEIDVRVKRSSSRRRASPPHRQVPVAHYVEARSAPRPRFLDEDRYLYPSNERTAIVTRRSRSRGSHSRGSSGSPGPARAPPPAAAQPVIVNNHIYNNEDSDSDEGHHATRRRSHSRASSGYSSYERELELKRRDYKREHEVRQKNYELERAQKELETLHLAEEEKRRELTAREQQELREAKKELDAMRDRKERADLEERMKAKINLEQLKQQAQAEQAKKERDALDKQAVERYKAAEEKRKLEEKQLAEEREREYKHRMQEQLLNSGLDEKEINAILSGKKIQKEKKEAKEKEKGKLTLIEDSSSRPTYTRMARRHLSLETLRVYDIDYTLDQDPSYVLIKRWVPEPEQDILWRHTRVVREQRESRLVLEIEDRKHHHHLDPQFEWVREKKHRRRSKSPGLLTYLAGGRPA